ncbi:hypothetical protein O2W14_12200 [Modestobacter sp. VKM Ac-2986]|uniref:hypothetical protein n=1 Tax=Modestobacter sp. VKM Ac-2986 TaxID=3004140 RepID=UPI0022AB71B5|nr:hypothetical protein [Modestobacter sp. VKM Ac-2986]MCZ2829596.1 hypothetical protein [Modestobacter sp. VKM Ac-2986]
MRIRSWSVGLTATALVAGAVVLAPGTASAAPPRTAEGSDLTLLCTGAGAAGSVELALDSWTDAGGAVTSGFLLVSAPDGQLVQVSEEGAGAVLDQGSSLTGLFPMLDATTYDPVGEASSVVGVVPAGDPVSTTDRTRTGNAWTSVTTVRQALTGSGTVLLASGDAVDVQCSGDRSYVTSRTMPAAFVQRQDGVDIGDPGPGCVTELADGRSLVLASEGLGQYVSVAVVSGSGFLAGESEQAVTSGGRVSATVALLSFEGEGGGEHVGDAVVDLAVTEVTGSERWELRQQRRTQTTTREDVVMSGTVLLPGGESVAVTCEGRRFLVREVVTPPSGPRSTGPAPGNDAPAGAVLLTPGGRASVQTGSAAPQPEADLWCYDNEPQDPGFLPAHSVWYRFTGTGGPVTVDTAGSTFNTTLSVHAGAPGAATEIACVDDDGPPVRTLQAYTTVDTVAGAEYLVQVGGLGGEYGLLKIALR